MKQTIIEVERSTMNKVILCGRLVRDPETRYTNKGDSSAVAKYTLAVDRVFKREGDPSADFINCVAFGKQAVFAEKYLHKGMKIIVEGRWQTGNFTSKDGQKVYTNDCVVDRHEFCESRGQKQEKPFNPNPMPQTSPDGFMQIPDDISDELPFA